MSSAVFYYWLFRLQIYHCIRLNFFLLSSLWRIRPSSSSSRMRVINHNWLATKQHPHPQSAAETSCHLVPPGDRTRQCETPPGSRHKDTDQRLQAAIPLRRHHSVPAPRENGPAKTTATEGGRNPAAGPLGHTPGENRPPEPTSSHAPIDLRCQLAANPAIGPCCRPSQTNIR